MKLNILIAVGGTCETHTSSNSALRCLKRSRWLVTIGRIDVSADGVNGIGVERIGVSCWHVSSALLALKMTFHYLLANIEVR